MPSSEHPAADRVRMLQHELALQAELDSEQEYADAGLGPVEQNLTERVGHATRGAVVHL